MNREKALSNRKTYVLVVDDDEGVGEFFKDLFEEMDIKVDIATSGTAGLNSAKAGEYKLIFLDINLGDISGLDVLEGIRKDNKDVKIIMISGYLTEVNIERALKTGADGYLYKPLQVRDIVSQTFIHVPLGELRNPGSLNSNQL